MSELPLPVAGAERGGALVVCFDREAMLPLVLLLLLLLVVLRGSGGDEDDVVSMSSLSSSINTT